MPNNAFSSLQGAFGIGKQSGQDSVASSILYVPVLSLGLEPNQIVNNLQPEVGGSLFIRGSYKGGVSGGGALNFYPRGDSFGHFLLALTGSDTVTGVSGQSGAYQHIFSPISFTGGQDLPWYTLIKDVSKLWANQFLNAKLDSLTLDIAKQQIVTASANWFATTPSEISVPGSETFDATADFVACSGSVSFLDELSGLNISSTASNSFERINLSFRNNLSQDQFVVGSYYPTGVTLLQRTAQATLDLIIRDKNIYEAIYQNGGSSAWSPTIKRANLTVTLTAATNIGTTTQPWQLIFNFPGVDLMMMPVAPSGAQLLRSTVTTMVTLGPSGADTYSITLISGQATY
jgi:hypothetical protein